MARRHEEEENYWPGFVDALSTIVMVITLLMIILVIIIFVITQMIEKTVIVADIVDTPPPILTPVENVQEVGVQSPDQAEEVKQVEEVETNNTLKIQSREVAEEKRVVVVGEEQAELDKEENKITVTSAKSILSVLFEGKGVELDEISTEDISSFLGENLTKLENQRISVYSFYDPNSAALSQAKRKAYFRLLSVRNVLIASGIFGDDLTVNVRPAQTKEEINEVRVFVK